MFDTPEKLFIAARERLGGNEDSEAFFTDVKLLERLNEWITEWLPQHIKLYQTQLARRIFAGSPSSPPVENDYSVYLGKWVTNVEQVLWSTGAYSATAAKTPLGSATCPELVSQGKDPFADIGTPYCFWTDFQPAIGAVVTVTGISAAAQAVCLCATAAAEWVGRRVIFQGIVGMVELNGQIGTIVSVSAGVSFTVDINTTGYTAWSSGSPYWLGSTPVLTVHPYPIPNVAGFMTVRAEARGVDQALSSPLVFPPAFNQACLRWLIFDMREVREEFDDAARGNAFTMYQSSLASALREYNMNIKDRSVQSRATRAVGK